MWVSIWSETVWQGECLSLSWEGRESQEGCKGTLLIKEDRDSKHSQESACLRGPSSVGLPTTWSICGCLWPQRARRLWDRQDDVICGVWSGQSLWCGQEWVTRRVMG